MPPAPPDRPASLIAELNASLLFFDSPEAERRWWRSWARPRLRGIELLGTCLALAAALCLYAAVQATNPAPAVDFPVAFALGMSVAQSAVHLLLLLPPCRSVYERVRDPGGMLLRGLLNPLASVAMRAAMSNPVPPPGHPVADGLHFLWAFGLVDGAIDWARYPLRLRDHLFVQALSACVWWAADGMLCESWLASGTRDVVGGTLCTAIGALTTGVKFDCTVLGTHSACVTGALQLQVLLGPIASTAVVYWLESRSREEFVRSGAGQGR